MATDTRTPKQPLTLADLCKAIADEKVSFTTHGGEYFLTALDLRRMERLDAGYDIPSGPLMEFGAVQGSAPSAH